MSQRFILIDAQSPIYGLKEVVEESKAPRRLEGILRSWNIALNQYQRNISGGHIEKLSDRPKLKVTTGIYNPEIPFK